MCGIAAVINGTRKDSNKMGNAIQHRGIKSSTTTVDNLTVTFAHLPITTNQYNQPFVCNGIMLWLNGYISNWVELSEKYNLPASNDTELLTKFIDQFGEEKLNELNGFFAVIYHNGSIHYFTDRYGIKQLYKYTENGTTFICSELKGIKAVVNLEIDNDALLDWNYSLGVMTENTIYKNVTRVDCLPFPKPDKIEISYTAAKIELKRLFDLSISRNKTELNDCVFLSGGIDSGIIAKNINPKYCFSVDYLNDLSEIENIKLNSKSKHYTIICNNDLEKEYSEKVFNALDDLKAGSCYTNFALTEFASKFSTVIYSGAGGDEVFNGFTHRYNKPINEVIKRTDLLGKTHDITHKDYDWLFLKAVLVVEDRMAGFHTMETRFPLLDNDFVDFALSLPDKYLNNKRILKDISELDIKVKHGKKRGFSNPHFTNKQWVNHATRYL